MGKTVMMSAITGSTISDENVVVKKKKSRSQNLAYFGLGSLSCAETAQSYHTFYTSFLLLVQPHCFATQKICLPIQEKLQFDSPPCGDIILQ